MTEKELTEIAKDNLSRVMSFFPRVDAVLSVILTVYLGMLAILAANTPSLQKIERFPALIAILFVLLVGVGMYHIYKCYFPRLEGGDTSLIYFRRVAEMNEDVFKEGFLNQNATQYLNDLLSPFWRNSEILKQKFDHLKYAFICLGISVIPWIFSLLMFTSNNQQNLLSK